jgi:hypothetical protein
VVAVVKAPTDPAEAKRLAARQAAYEDGRRAWREAHGVVEAPIPIVEPKGPLEEVPAD